MAQCAGRSIDSLDVMYRHIFLLSVLIGCASCVPVKSARYEAVDRPRVASATNGNLLACPPINGYWQGSLDAALNVNAYVDSRQARVEVLAYVYNSHRLTFKTFELQLVSLSTPTIRSLIPVAFYRNCKGSKSDRSCPRENPEDHTLSEPAGSDSLHAQAQFIGFADVPPELADGFQVTLPEIFDRTVRVDTKPLKFQRRNDVLLRGLGGCE